jgi:cysteine desulfurase
MIYFDETATTRPDPDVLRQFVDDSRHFYANPNSTHVAGKEAKTAIDDATAEILAMLGAHDHAITYVSGATEANNLAIKGTAAAKGHLGRHVMTTPFEHPSVTACFNRLADDGFDVDMVPLADDGHVDVDALAEMLRDDTVLVSVGLVQSETGIVQDIDAIKQVLKPYPDITFHMDVTQAIGKIDVDLDPIDLASFSAHKFNGIRGIGGLVRRSSIPLKSIIDGGHALDHLRSGTPVTALILSMRNALRSALDARETQEKHVRRLRAALLDRLQNVSDRVKVNSPEDAVPHIVNLSFIGHRADHLHQALSKKGICVSTQTACSSESSVSKTILMLTGSRERAVSSLRISLSGQTTDADIQAFTTAIGELIEP